MDSESETRRESKGCQTDDAEYPGSKPVHALFEEQAAEAPYSVALSFEDLEVTYGQLNERSNRLAHRLRRLGIGRGTLVGLCMERSADLIVGLLGILKAGGAYLPLDPDYPDERLALMLRDAGAPAIVAHRPTEDRLAPWVRQARVICLDTDAAAIATEPGANPEGMSTADDLAYVMYTSGSTGTPKGVLIRHRSVVRLVRNTNYCRFGPEDVLLQLAPISFDASTFEIWGALLNGAHLAIMPPRIPALHEIGVAIRRHGVTTLWLTSGLFNLMVEKRVADLRPLRQLLAGGDVLSPSHVQKALDALRDGVVINGYGPTECTTFACCFRMMKGYRAGATIPIGTSISNTTAFVLDEHLQPVPLGEAGELFIGGDGLARGYLNDPELTQRKFVPDPFGDDPEARLFRTGDLARYRPDGNLEFLGRIDDQVKVLGHRVEPGEIEAILRQHPAVRQAVVVARPDPRGEKHLVAYIVGMDEVENAPADLKRYLEGRLPPHMIPSLFIRLDSLPLSPNGKVDRSAFPAPDRSALRNDAPTTPGTGLEREISMIWESVLGCRVGPDDNFFDLGGDSLLLIDVHSELQKRLPRELSIMELFENPTVRALAGRLASEEGREPAFTHVEERAKKQREALARRQPLKAAP